MVATSVGERISKPQNQRQYILISKPQNQRQYILQSRLCHKKKRKKNPEGGLVLYFQFFFTKTARFSMATKTELKPPSFPWKLRYINVSPLSMLYYLSNTLFFRIFFDFHFHLVSIFCIEKRGRGLVLGICGIARIRMLYSLKRQQSPLKRQQSPLKRQQSPLKRQQSPLKRQQSPLKRQQSVKRNPFVRKQKAISRPLAQEGNRSLHDVYTRVIVMYQIRKWHVRRLTKRALLLRGLSDFVCACHL